MAGLPRRHLNSVPSWVEVTTCEAGPGNQPQGSVSKVASNNRSASLPG